MDSGVIIGPLMLAADRGLAVLCVVIFLGLATLADRYSVTRLSAVATSAVLAGLVTARIGYVAAHWSIYADAPLAILAFWQGGFSGVEGVFGAAVMLAVGVHGKRALAMAGAVLTVPTVLWFALQALIPPVSYGLFPYKVTLVTQAAEPVPMERLRGRPFVVNLWATWCGPCRRELPMLEHAASGGSAVPILLADQGEAPATAAGFLAREGIGSDHVLFDPASALSRVFEVAGYPATAFVAADGTVVELQLGELSRAALADGIDMARNHK